MTRDELFALRRQDRWDRMVRLQQQVMPLVYAMGNAFVVNEVDIRPDDRIVYILGTFRDCDAWIRIERPINGGPIVPWLELKVVDNPETVPESCPAPIRKLEDDAGVELVFRRSFLSLGTEAHGCKDGDMLRSVFEHLLANVARVKELLSGPEEEAVPFESKRGTIAVPRRDALVN